MLLKDLIEVIEKEYPKNLAYEWDNVGLLCGGFDRDIKKALVSLDVNSSIVREAAELGADLILSHHPILIDPINRITTDTETGKMLHDIIGNNICVYAAHTNMDCAENGINTRLAEIFNLKNIEVLEPRKESETTGIGRIGNLKLPMSLAEFAIICKEKLNTPVRISGNPDLFIKRAAVGSGNCSSAIPSAIAKNADVIVTGDIKYHTAIDAVLSGLAVIDAGHYPTEIIAMDMFAELLKPLDLEVFKSKQQDIFRFI